MIKLVNILGNPKIFNYTIVWMMILVFFGTIAQKDIGLYFAQQKFFSNWITWFWIIPTPGGRLTMLIMLINILGSFCSPNLWKIKKTGIIIVHLGILLLLIGGGLTAYFSFEGNMVIDEGETTDFIESYHDSELIFIKKNNSQFDEVIAFTNPILKNGKILQHEAIPFKIKIIQYLPNAEPIRRTEPKNNLYHGMSKNFMLIPKANEKEAELNRPGVLFKITNSNTNSDGFYSLILGQSVMQTIQIDGIIYNVQLRKERIYLPFEIELLDFVRVIHPGTTIPKSFSSEVNLIEKSIPRRVLIKMNEPLRHKGFTFFQASFSQTSEGETSVLAVVQNYGRLFPYISSIVMCLGLLIHLLLQLPRLIKSEPIN